MATAYLDLTAEEQGLLADIAAKLEPFHAGLARQAADIVAHSAELDERYYPQGQLHPLIADACARHLASLKAGNCPAQSGRIRAAVEQNVAFASVVVAPAVVESLAISALPQIYGDNAERLMQAVTTLVKAINLLFVQVAEQYLAAKEEVIRAQQQAMLQLSTPVIQVWEGILVAPLVGAIDSERAMQITQNLLNMVRDTKASIAIIDISGVPMVDTLVANHLLKTVRAARLLGAKCLIVGISPEIAETLINLGVDMSGIDTYSSLHTGLQHAFRELGQTVGANHVG